MLELVASAGSPEAVSAAVQNGATAVYVSFGAPDSVKTSLDMTYGDFARAAEFCRQRGVKIYAVIDYLPTDGEFAAAVKTARMASRTGADALVVSDPGLIRVLRRVVPELPLFGGEKLNIHNADGVKIAAAMGLKRITLARELSLAEIASLSAAADIETEVIAHGPTCPSYAGFCHLSEAQGAGSSLRGQCALVCREAAASGAKEPFPLKLKDTCLLTRLAALEKAGVAAVRITGRERRAEYTALATEVYARAVRDSDSVTAGDGDLLRSVFSPGGLCEAWLDGPEKSADMTARAASDAEVSPQFFTSVRKAYLNREYQHVAVWFYGTLAAEKPLTLSVADDRGNLVEMTGPVPEPAFHQETTFAVLQTELLKTGGTPFYCDGVKCAIDKGLYLPTAEIGKLRDALLAELLERRKAYPPRVEFDYDSFTLCSNPQDPPALTVSVADGSQLSDALLEIAPTVLTIPLWKIEDSRDALRPFIEREGITVAALLPGVVRDGEREAVEALLQKAAALGIRHAMVSSFAHILLARRAGFLVMGDIGLNIYNSRTLGVLQELGLISAALPFTMTAEEARTLSKTVPAEMIVYGRLPLMLTETCISKAATGVCSCGSFAGLAGADGLLMPVVSEYGCRNVVLSARRLFLAGRMKDYMTAGLAGVRLSFTTENAAECALIAGRYLGMNKHTPAAVMRGIHEN